MSIHKPYLTIQKEIGAGLSSICAEARTSCGFLSSTEPTGQLPCQVLYEPAQKCCNSMAYESLPKSKGLDEVSNESGKRYAGLNEYYNLLFVVRGLNVKLLGPVSRTEAYCTA